MEHEELTKKIIGCAMKVHSTLGNGFQEVIYQRALAIEMKHEGIEFEREQEMNIYYRNEYIGTRRVDFFVENTIMVELKAIINLEDVHLAQAMNYLEAYKMKIGLLINFGSKSLQAQKEFIKLYGGILKIKNILSSFDDFAGNEILTERDVQDYHSMYINLYNEFRGKNKGDSENVNDDIVFEMELIKQVEINIDYILELIRKYHEGHLQDKEIVITIGKAIDASVELRNKKDLIVQFVNSLTPEASIDNDWQQFVSGKQKEELNRIIADENLNKEETEKFVKNAFRDGFIPETGTAITKLLPPLNPFAPDNQYSTKKTAIIEKLKQFFERFWGVINNAD